MPYTLKLSETEIARYRRMAGMAQEAESSAWAAAGIVPGAKVADVGCGPGLTLCELAKAVSPGGEVAGVEQDPGVAETATAIIEHEGITNAHVIVGDAGATGLEPESFDVVMMRHVLAHNGGREAEIVAHVASLLRPGGHLYLVDTDLTAVRVVPDVPDVADLTERYITLMTRRGNDLSVGPKLSHLLDTAGLEVVDREGRYHFVERTGEIRGPQWAARDALIDEGLATEADFERWEVAFQRDVAAAGLKLILMPVFRAVGRRSLG